MVSVRCRRQGSLTTSLRSSLNRMEELLETYDETLTPIGLAPRSRVHKLGLWHKATNVFLFRSDGRLVTQLRHESKDVYPSTWDLSVAEHLQPGETYLEGALRGLKEELGVADVNLKPIGKEIRARVELAESEVRDYEFQMSFVGTTDADFFLKQDEVAKVKLIDLQVLREEMINSPDAFTPWFRDRALDVGLIDRY